MEPPAAAPERFLSVTVAAAPLVRLDTALSEIFDRIKPGRMPRREGTFDPLDLYLTEPVAGGAHPHRVTISSPVGAAETSILLTNLRDGWSSLSMLVARAHLALQAQVRSTPVGVEYPLHSLQIWRGGETDRYVRVMRDDDRWTFYERGSVQPFEDQSSYRRHRVSDRIGRSTLLDYCRALGWDLASPDFWTASGDAVHYDEVRN